MNPPETLIPRPVKVFSIDWWRRFMDNLSTEYICQIEEGKGVKVVRTRGTPHAVRIQADPVALRSLLFGESDVSGQQTTITYIADFQVNTATSEIWIQKHTATIQLLAVATADWSTAHTGVTCTP